MKVPCRALLTLSGQGAAGPCGAQSRGWLPAGRLALLQATPPVELAASSAPGNLSMACEAHCAPPIHQRPCAKEMLIHTQHTQACTSACLARKRLITLHLQHRQSDTASSPVTLKLLLGCLLELRLIAIAHVLEGCRYFQVALGKEDEPHIMLQTEIQEQDCETHYDGCVNCKLGSEHARAKHQLKNFCRAWQNSASGLQPARSLDVQARQKEQQEHLFGAGSKPPHKTSVSSHAASICEGK